MRWHHTSLLARSRGAEAKSSSGGRVQVVVLVLGLEGGLNGGRHDFGADLNDMQRRRKGNVEGGEDKSMIVYI